MKTYIVLLLVAGSLCLQGCSTTNHENAGSKWEYRVVSNLEEVNRMAANGWVVAGFSMAVQPSGNTEEFYLIKHPKE
jgi:hypothetical protein